MVAEWSCCLVVIVLSLDNRNSFSILFLSALGLSGCLTVVACAQRHIIYLHFLRTLFLSARRDILLHIKAYSKTPSARCFPHSRPLCLSPSFTPSLLFCPPPPPSPSLPSGAGLHPRGIQRSQMRRQLRSQPSQGAQDPRRCAPHFPRCFLPPRPHHGVDGWCAGDGSA